MTYLSHARLAFARRHPLPLYLIVAAAVASGSAPATARLVDEQPQVRISVAGVDLDDSRSLARVRRQIGMAADTLCNASGLAGIYRSAAQRCRVQAIADAEVQLAGLLASRTGA